MRLVHAQDVPAPVDEVWAAFTDLRRVGRCFPGAKVTEVSGDDFVGVIKVRLGPVTMTYDGTGTMTEADEARHRAVVTASGQERHGFGKADITITVDLRAQGSGTHVDVQTDLDVRGAPTNLGGGLAQRVSDPLVGSFITCMGGGAEPSDDEAPLDVARSVIPGLVSSYGRSLRDRVRRR